MLNILSSVRERFASHSLASPPKPRLQRKLPKVKSRVLGFSIQVERKDGCVLKTRPKDSPEDTPYTDSGVDEHFEVTVTFDGKNHHFPKTKGPWTYLLTNDLREESGYGFSGNMHFQPFGDKFTKVEVVEEYDDHRNTEFLGSGRPSGPEMIVWVRIHVKRADGHDSPSGCGIASRPATGERSG